MKFHTRLKHLNVDFGKYSRIIFVVLVLIGVGLAFFISNVNQYKFTQADSFTHQGIAGVATNGFYKVATFGDNTFADVSFQWGGTFLDINHHYNTSDYTQYNTYTTDIFPNSLDSIDSIAFGSDGTAYMVDHAANKLKVMHSGDYTNYDAYDIPGNTEGQSRIALDSNNNDVYSAQSSKLIKFLGSDYNTATSFPFINGRTDSRSVAVNPNTGFVYVLFESYVQVFDSTNSYAATEIPLTSNGITCGQYARIHNGKLYISDTCDDNVRQFALSGNSITLEDTYQIFPDITDFQVNDNYIYVANGNQITKYNIGDPVNATRSDALSNVTFPSISLLGNDVLVLSSYYREIYRFHLIVGANGGTCAVDTPPYIQNDTRCERWVYDSSNLVNTGIQSDQAIIVGANKLILQGANQLNGQIYVDGNVGYPLPVGYDLPRKIIKDPNGNGAFVLAENSSSSAPVILYFSLDTGFYSPFTTNLTASEYPNDFAVDSTGNIIMLVQNNADTFLTILPYGDYGNPVNIQPDFDLSNGIFNAKIQVSSTKDLYVLGDNKIRTIPYNGGLYDSSTQVNVDNYNYTRQLYIVNKTGGLVDAYVTGQYVTSAGSVERFTNLDNTGNFDSEDQFAIGVGQYGANELNAITVDPYGNMFAVPVTNQNTVAWISPNGDLHDINLNDVNGDITNVLLDSSNNLFVTSQNIPLQKFAYNYLPTSGVANFCINDNPPYLFDRTRCERYPYSGVDGSGPFTPPAYFKESVLVQDHLVAIDTDGILFVSGVNYNAPPGFTNGRHLMADPDIHNYGVFYSALNGFHLNIIHLNIAQWNFDYSYDTSIYSDNYDYKFDSNGDLYIVTNDGGTTHLYLMNKGQLDGTNDSWDIDSNMSCSSQISMRMDPSDNMYIYCDNKIKGLSPSDNYRTTQFDLTLDNTFDFSGNIQDMFIKPTANNHIDMYVSGQSLSEGKGKIIKLENLNMSGGFDNQTDYVANTGNFQPSVIQDVIVDPHGSIFASSDNYNQVVGRFLQSGEQQDIDLPTDFNTVEDINVDSHYNVFVTSKYAAYQLFNYQFSGPNNSGALTCVVSGDFTLRTIDVFGTTTFGGYVDGVPEDNADPYPTGSIEIRVDGLPYTNATLNGTADTTLDVMLDTAGAHNITLYYPGDENFSGCLASAGVVVVNGLTGADAAVTITNITPTNQSQITGEYIDISAHVEDPNNGVTPTGTVELRQDICCSGGYNVLATGTLNGSGNYVFHLNNILPGGYAIYIQYMGDDYFATARSINNYINIYSIQTSLSLESSQNPVNKGDSITLTAHLTLPNFTPSGSSPVVKTGWVFFRVGTFNLDQALVDSNGFASTTINTSDLPVDYRNLNVGVHHIRAYYEPLLENRNTWLRASNSETLFQAVVETGSGGGGGGTGNDVPPSGGEGGNSDLTATISGKDKLTGSVSETKIGSVLDWIMNYNNLGPNSNGAVTYFPIRENQDFVIGSVKAPVNWTITYSQDQGCDDSTFTYTPSGVVDSTDPQVRCVRFETDRISVPATRSDIRYITSSSTFGELNVASLGGVDVYKVVTTGNKLFYFNHHWLNNRINQVPTKTLFCFDLEINDTCVSSNPNIVYPLVIGIDGFNNPDDEFSSKTSFSVDAEAVNNKLYIPMTDVNFTDGTGGGHGFLCWDLATDYYCTGSSFKEGFVGLNTSAYNAWGWGNIGAMEYNPDMQELYSISVGPNDSRMVLLCYSLATNAPCVGQPYELGTVQGYDPGMGLVAYQHSTGRIYTSGGGNTGSVNRQIMCMISSTKTICPDFPAGGVRVLPGKPNQSVFINPNNDQMCAFLYSDGTGSDGTAPRIYCYDLNTESFYDYLPNMATSHLANDMYHDLNGPYPDGKLYYMAKWSDAVVECWDVNTGNECAGWEGGKTGSPFDDRIYTMRYAFGCMWGASDSGRVFTFDPETGGTCNPLITLSQGNVAVKLDATGMFCATNPTDISWNKVKVLDSGTSPSPVLLNASVYDSANCTTDNNVVTCTGSPLKSGNLLLNSGHEMSISDISYAQHSSLTAILEFQYPSIPSPAPGFYIELNPSNKAQMCASTKLGFSGALCANPITTVCENTNISYINDPVSNNNGGQACLNVETYFGKDPNSALCFVAATPEQRIFTVFNPNATVSTGGQPDFNPEQTYNRGPGSYSFGNGFFGFFQNVIENVGPQIITEDSLKNLGNSITTQTPLALTAVTAITTASVVATSIFAAGSGIGQIFGVLLGFFVPKKKKYWGIIFDDLTNKPISFASITLSSKEIGTDNQMKSKVITQSVSDLDGRYRLNTDKRDKFYLEVKASGYQPYSKFISMTNPLNSAEDIVYDIPLRRIDAKSNIFKTLVNYRKKGLINAARIILLALSIVGFIFTIYTQINFPSNINIVLLIVYILLFFVSFYPSIYSRIQKRGKVVDVDQKLVIPGAVVRIYDTKQQLSLSLTNAKGEARFDLASGEYSILASKRGYKMVTEAGKQLIRVTLKTEGYLDRDILMKRIEEAPSQQSGDLDNPFA